MIPARKRRNVTANAATAVARAHKATVLLDPPTPRAEARLAWFVER